MLAHSLQRVMSLPFATPTAFIESQRAGVQGIVQILASARINIARSLKRFKLHKMGGLRLSLSNIHSQQLAI